MMFNLTLYYYCLDDLLSLKIAELRGTNLDEAGEEISCDANLMLHYAYKRHFNDEGKGEASKIVG